MNSKKNSLNKKTQVNRTWVPCKIEKKQLCGRNYFRISRDMTIF